MRVTIDALTVEVAGARLVREVSLTAGSGRVVGLVGPNGSGKSTVLRCLYRALRPASGTILLDDEELSGLTPREGARRVAALPQETSGEFDFTVAELVAMGRIPHRGTGGRTTADDEGICAAALERVHASHLAERSFGGLSGGEKQRVLIARALAQQPRVLVLDEPTNHLDIAQQLEVLALVRDSGLTVLAALHDLNLAACHCDELYVIAGGAIVASGPPERVLTAELLAEVFGVAAHPVRHPVTGAVQLLFDRLPAGPPGPRGPAGTG
ncbi:ABC transporter ATP-binding protein [Streptomyces sp. ST2-7A]|uniref:ABC transporter ATP-binding protein n=1 Tax=Streptomyces sp. ST2-7A TaxID=2907214 RepID=UPI001F4119A7|nr:ABC transporter ATP-binding protein [Streptomyces sp. ST2-7A]MCE7080256.1 ABC transporter ATP-binding protein [Streptomyces sp. ST2-7A]